MTTFGKSSPCKHGAVDKRNRHFHCQCDACADERRAKDRARMKTDKYRLYDKTRDKTAAKARHYAKHKDVYLARAAYRQALLLSRTVPWADLAAIKAVYAEARRISDESGIPHEVDHIVPLRGELISGLHIETNLQIITAAANRAKGNKWTTD